MTSYFQYLFPLSVTLSIVGRLLLSQITSSYTLATGHPRC